MMLDRCYLGDCRCVMLEMIAAGVRVQSVVTSPPYWGLRDYGVAGQLGLERTPTRYIARMRSVFRLVWEVLADDGVLWLNMGDSYAGAAGGYQGKNGQRASRTFTARIKITKRGCGLKPKDLVGIPWLLALALRADGWYLRRDIIWHKPNPMPESVTDRPATAHEYIFMLTKSERYYYDAEAIKEPVTGNAHARGSNVNPKSKIPSGFSHAGQKRARQNESFNGSINELVDERNKRSVWTVPTQPFPGAHFATFPERLVEPCILAGSRPGDIVFDPFMGAGTVAAVATRLGRRWLGAELNPQYVELQKPRSAQQGLQL